MKPFKKYDWVIINTTNQSWVACLNKKDPETGKTFVFCYASIFATKAPYVLIGLKSFFTCRVKIERLATKEEIRLAVKEIFSNNSKNPLQYLSNLLLAFSDKPKIK